METNDELSTFSSWQVPYFCLTLLEKAAHLVPKQVIISAMPLCRHLFPSDRTMHTAQL